MNSVIPSIGRRFLCIVDRDNPQLAAVICSYLNLAGEYLLLFEMPGVTAVKSEGQDEDQISEHSLSQNRASELAVLFNNVLARIGGVENLILAGLSEAQLSFVRKYDGINTIELSNIDDAHQILSPFFDRKDYFSCRPDQVLQGLDHALRNGSWLLIDEFSDDVPIDNNPVLNGLVVVENDSSTNSVLAVNYARSIGADLQIVASLNHRQHYEIRHLLADWGNRKNEQLLAEDAFQEIERVVMSRVHHIDFSNYEFATFFTWGIPYSFILKDIIPFSYVSMIARPDLFIVNNLLNAGIPSTGSAVLFSPVNFKKEEIGSLKMLLEAENFSIKSLIGSDATSYELGKTLAFYPYDIAHICSHGGEVKGRTYELDFVDSHGEKHCIEYEEVLDFEPIPDNELVQVTAKYFPQKMDGIKYHTREMEVSNLPHYVFADAINAVHGSDRKNIRQVKDFHTVNHSCGISCYKGLFQGTLFTLADHSSPFVFNNTCYSAFEIADAFLHAGALGYIGTMWQVDNDIAVKVAEIFYTNAFNSPVTQALWQTTKLTSGSDSEYIYLFWGLHFTQLKPSPDKEANFRVYKRLMVSKHLWEEKFNSTPSSIVKNNSLRIFRWLVKELNKFNQRDMLKKMFSEFMRTKGAE